MKEKDWSVFHLVRGEKGQALGLVLVIAWQLHALTRKFFLRPPKYHLQELMEGLEPTTSPAAGNAPGPEASPASGASTASVASTAVDAPSVEAASVEAGPGANGTAESRLSEAEREMLAQMNAMNESLSSPRSGGVAR